jgi:hypothetical protein
VETVTLIPMGCARLRISAFPVIGEGPDAQPWPEPPHADIEVTASHCFGSDTVRAACDELVPKNSNDHSIPRMTWWPHRGTEEWIQYRFDEPKQISQVEVYWFDDTGRGHCRVPESWKLLVRDGDEWKPVETSDHYGTQPNRFNSVKFDPVTTQAIRLEVQLKPDFSAGVLELRVR